MDYNKYIENKEKCEKAQKELMENMRAYANRLFSSEDGRKYANQMLTAVKYFDALPSNISDNDLRYYQAQKDFVNVFLVGLVDKSVLFEILKER